MIKSHINRREAMAGALAAGAVTLTSPISRVLGANNDIRAAVIGFRSKGSHHISIVSKIPGVRIVALCDADSDVLANGVKRLEKEGSKVDGYTDMRRIMDRNDIDVIFTATPNHWHALTAIWGVQSGKHVYVEKPVSHNIWEGRQIVNASNRYGKLVQTGTQSRSDIGMQAAVKYINEGHIGKLKVARGFCYKHRPSIGHVTSPQQWPAEIDKNLWTGPSTMKPLMRKKVHYDWHWDFETGNGDVGNQGIHQMDLARWVTGEQLLPKRVMSIGGRFGYIDDGNTPNTQITLLDYDNVPVIFEVRGLPEKSGSRTMPHYKGVRVGVVYECEGGYFAGNNGGWIYDNDDKKIKQIKGGGSGDHQKNFIDAVRAGKREMLTADILEGHISSALCHMGNISHQVGRQTSQGEIKDAIKDNPNMLEAYQRFEEHLAVNDVDFNQTPRILGPMLQFDPTSESFNDERFKTQANQLVKRDYRKPFVVPDLAQA